MTTAAGGCVGGVLVADPPPQPEDVRGADVGVQPDEVRLAVPEEPGVADQVMHLVRFARAAEPPLVRGEANPSRLGRRLSKIFARRLRR